MDGTVCGNGAGPRTMDPFVGNVVLASADSVAIDAVAAKIMGFDPMSIPYLRMATERGLGEARIDKIEIAGEDIGEIEFSFQDETEFRHLGRSDAPPRTAPFSREGRRSIRRSSFWAPMASQLYHDVILVSDGRARGRSRGSTGRSGESSGGSIAGARDAPRRIRPPTGLTV